MNSRQKQSIETKKKIASAALYLLQTEGYENLRVREICNAANVSTGAYYHHFKSKDDIFQFATGDFDEYLTNVLRSYRNENHWEFLCFVLLNQADYIANHPTHLMKEYYRVLFSSQSGYIFNESRAYFKAIKEQVAHCLKDHIFRDDYSEEYLTHFFFRSVRGEILDWCLHDYEYDLVSHVKQDLGIIFSGICSRPT